MTPVLCHARHSGRDFPQIFDLVGKVSDPESREVVLDGGDPGSRIAQFADQIEDLGQSGFRDDDPDLAVDGTPRKSRRSAPVEPYVADPVDIPTTYSGLYAKKA